MPFTPEQLEAAIGAQHDAAHDDSDPVRLIAGPGTGKSHTIEERVCWLLDQGSDPAGIAVASFTRASALDLQRRVRHACSGRGHAGDVINVTTLHSLALRALRAHGALEAYPADPVVLDRWELRDLFDEEFGHSAGIGSVTRRREIRQDHEAFWNTGEHEVPPSQGPPDPPISETERRQFRSFHGPRTQLYSCVLPGEIIQRCVQYMESGTLDPVVLLGLEDLIVDEFQDLNPMDLRFVYGMAERGARLFVAGDDDQSLYSFRYAFPEGIQRFTERYEAAGDHALHNCFRCTPRVLNCAETLIEQFSTDGRIEKSYVSLYEDAEPPVQGGLGCWEFRSARDEARAIAQSCARLIEAGLEAREIMVLLSNVNALAWELRRAFEEVQVPYEPPRETRFKDTDAGRALLTLLRLVGRPEDYVAMRTLLSLRRGIGVATAVGIADVAIERHLNYRDLLYAPLPEDAFTNRETRALRGARDVAGILESWSGDDAVLARTDDINQLLELILGATPETSWEDEAEQLPEGATLSELADYLTSERDDEQAAVLAAIHLRLGNAMRPEDALPPRVRVMTMHGAKGLSAQIVFIPGLEEEILPGDRRRPYVGQVLEAARMLYVSITRARLGCLLSFARSRFINGRWKTHTPSRYTPHLGKPFERRDGGMTEALARRVGEIAQTM
jgi:DNA helicase-2/ATP-dependent DNA helicase PcrA